MELNKETVRRRESVSSIKVSMLQLFPDVCFFMDSDGDAKINYPEPDLLKKRNPLTYLPLFAVSRRNARF